MFKHIQWTCDVILTISNKLFCGWFFSREFLFFALLPAFAPSPPSAWPSFFSNILFYFSLVVSFFPASPIIYLTPFLVFKFDAFWSLPSLFAWGLIYAVGALHLMIAFLCSSISWILLLTLEVASTQIQWASDAHK